MARHRDHSNPAVLLEEDSDQDEVQPQRQNRSNRSKYPSHRAVTGNGVPEPHKNLRPEEVTEEVWLLAEQWLEVARLHFERPARVNKRDFSKRLSEKINRDENLRRWLSISPKVWESRFNGKWPTGRHFVNDVLAKTMDLFFKHLTDEATTSNIQFAFLEDEWDEWIYQATTAIQAAWHKEHSEWVKYALPGAVFDPSTVGIPEDDAPCTDPEFEGMTWGEVRALANEDTFEDRDDSGEDPIRERMAEAGQTFARLKSAMVANRKATTTKETTNEDPA